MYANMKPRRDKVPMLLGMMLASCACASALDPSPDIGQHAHRTVKISRTNAAVKLPLIDGKDIRFTHYSTEEGLSQSRVDHMLQDNQGFLWFGTYNGLNRFDGYSFQIYKPQPNNPNSLGGVTIYSLFQDRSGVLWIGVGQGLDRFDPVTQMFTHFYSSASDTGSPSGHVEHITQDRDGMVWLATRNGLDRLDPGSLRFTHYHNDPSDPHSLSSNDTRFTLEDREGTLWVATAAGIDAFNHLSGRVTRHYRSPNSPLTPLDRIFEDRSGTLCQQNREGREPRSEYHRPASGAVQEGPSTTRAARNERRCRRDRGSAEEGGESLRGLDPHGPCR
jgi:streptogramin lyase